eukprot:2444875-Amphidinium_carterae.1
MLPVETELQVLQMIRASGVDSWLLRNRKAVLEAPNHDAMVSLELPPEAPGDGYEKKIYGEICAGVESWSSALSLSSVADKEETVRTGVSALRFIDQQLGHGQLSVQQAYELLTRCTVTLQPLSVDSPHLVAACICRAHGPQSPAIAVLGRDEALCLGLPKAPKKQGILNSAAPKKWVQDVRERLCVAVKLWPVPEPPRPVPVGHEILLRRGLRVGAWPL